MSTAHSSSNIDEVGARRVVAMGIGLLVVAIFGLQLVRSAFVVLLLPVFAFAFLFLTAPRYAVYFMMAFFTLFGVIPWLFPTLGFLTSGMFTVTTGVALLAGFLGALYFLLSKSNPFRYTTTLPFLCFIAICALSGYLSVDRVLALRRIVKIACSFIFMLVVADTFRTREHYRQLWKVTLWTSVIPLSVSLYQIATGTVPYFLRLGMGRLWATFTNPNEFGLYLVLLAPLALAHMFEKKMGRFRFVAFGFAMALGGCLVLTRSRGAWIGFLVAIVAYCFVTRRWRILAFIVPAATATILLSPATMERIQDQARAGSWEWRVRQWSLVVPYFQENPLLGIGLESSYVHWMFGESYAEGATTMEGSPASVHNTYLQFLVETGAIGLMMLLWLLSTGIRTAYAAAKKHSQDPVLGMSGALSFSFLLAFCVMALNWSLFGAPGREIWFWFALGVAEGVYRIPAAAHADARVPAASEVGIGIPAPVLG